MLNCHMFIERQKEIHIFSKASDSFIVFRTILFNQQNVIYEMSMLERVTFLTPIDGPSYQENIVYYFPTNMTELKVPMHELRTGSSRDFTNPEELLIGKDAFWGPMA